MPRIQATKDILELLSYLATIVGIALAVAIYYRDRQREHRELTRRIHEIPNTLYAEYLRLCLENPDLDIFDVPGPSTVSPENKKREWIAFTILISTMERAFLLYRDHPGVEWSRQWPGWERYIQWWLSRANFSEAWGVLADQFDEDFVSYVNALPARHFDPGDYTHAHWYAAVPRVDEPPQSHAR